MIMYLYMFLRKRTTYGSNLGTTVAYLCTQFLKFFFSGKKP